MAKPVKLAVDDGPQVPRAVERGFRRRPDAFRGLLGHLGGYPVARRRRARQLTRSHPAKIRFAAALDFRERNGG